ncbi:hypothetical protein [Brevundimonas sp.]|uniref:hypothetical protein n=1 Tax=Brevundimonas sp. TaxID=1871086 RepID=UPI0025BA50D9|nr:hypothetical protein [Brevundimonas sp.]
MSRIVAIGLTALILAACEPADQTPTAEPHAPAQAAEAPAPAPVAASAPQRSAPMSWEAMQNHYRQMEVEPTDPVEALEFRAVVCSHFAGEMGSGDPEREQFLNAQIDRYRCEPLVAEVRAMRDARSDAPAVAARLDTILEGIPY